MQQHILSFGRTQRESDTIYKYIYTNTQMESRKRLRIHCQFENMKYTYLWTDSSQIRLWLEGK